MAKKPETKELSEAGEQILKKKPRGKNIGETLAPIVEPGDNQKYIALTMELYKMAKVDMQDIEAVDKRLEEYFQLFFEADMKPTVVGMAMALGISRQELWGIKTGVPYNGRKTFDFPPTAVCNSVKKAYSFMENLWENYMQNGKINPVSGIFLGKNNYGYQDKTEYVVTPNAQTDSDYNAEDIKKRYLTDSSDSDSGDSDS